MSSGRRAAAVAIAAGVVVAACRCADDSASVDGGGSDAWVPVDAATASDAGPRDSAPAIDAARDPAWINIEGLPTPCDIRVARDPAAIVPSLGAAACEGDIEGCRRVVFRPSPEGTERVRVVSWSASWDSARDRGLFLWWWTDPVGRRVAVVTDDAGRTVAVWDYDFDYCAVHNAEIESDTVALALGRGEETNKVLVVSPVDVPSETAVYRLDEDAVPLTASVSMMAMSPETIGGIVTLNLRAWRLERDNGLVRRIPAGIEPTHAVDVTDAIGRHVFAHEYASSTRVWVSAPEGDSVFIDPVGADAAMLTTDGVDMAWQQGSGERLSLTGYERLELWTAPFTLDPRAVTPRMVAVLPRTSVMYTSDIVAHRVAIPLSRTAVVAYSLDGHEHRIVQVPDDRELEVLYLSATELAVLVFQAAPRMPMEVRIHTLESLPVYSE